MSVQELHAQISAVSGDIERQKRVLNKLERTKSLLQRQLNDILDPIAKLPLEIASEIFLQCLPLPPQPTGIHHIPTVLLQICHAWAEIALSTAGLWTELRIVLPSSRGFPVVLEGWIKRAHRPLRLHVSINFDRNEAVDPAVSAVLQRHSALLAGLEIELKDYASESCIPFPSTETEPMPQLQHLRISSVSDSESVCRWSTLLQLLHRSPNLVSFSVSFLDFVGSMDDETEALVLPYLRQLSVSSGDSEPDSGNDKIFRMITAPGLESLHLTCMLTLSNNLLSFLQRSSPPLQELVFDCVQMTGPIELLDGILSIVPTLIKLEIEFSAPETIEQLSTILTRTHPSRALPNLET